MLTNRYKLFVIIAFLLLIAVVTAVRHADTLREGLIDFLVDEESLDVEKVLKACAIKDFPFKNITKLPSHWKAVETRGVDSAPGYFESTEKGLKINYDIGSGLGVEHMRTRRPFVNWHQLFFYKSDIILCFRNDNMIYISITTKEKYKRSATQYYENSLFGAEAYRKAGMMSTRSSGDNFYAEFKSEEELEYIIELVARHWRELFENRKKLKFRARGPDSKRYAKAKKGLVYTNNRIKAEAHKAHLESCWKVSSKAIEIGNDGLISKLILLG
jgi:hypothetical protein